jgi:hypothetical protein
LSANATAIIFAPPIAAENSKAEAVERIAGIIVAIIVASEGGIIAVIIDVTAAIARASCVE